MSPLRKNPVFWLMWAIPGAAVLAGLGMVAIATQGADRALPEMYHWEGARLDADFERARLAARLRLVATLELRDGHCVVSLENAPPAESLRLQLTSSNDAASDRALMLVRAPDGEYRAQCAPLPAGRWRVALHDAAEGWALRERFEGELTRLQIRARDPAGEGA